MCVYIINPNSRCHDAQTVQPEQREYLQRIISISGGRAGAVEYLKSVEQALHPNAVQIGVSHLRLLHINFNHPGSLQFQ
jgi:hypothetical protein